jgi:hypothetical protein
MEIEPVKPLPVAPLTIEDGRIWAWVLVRFLPGIGLGIVSQASDRRDAELMRLIEVARKWETDHPEEFREYLGWGFVHCLLDTTVEAPGTCIGFEGSDITFCA